MPALKLPPQSWAVPKLSSCSSWQVRCSPAAGAQPVQTAGCPLVQLQQQPHCWGQSRLLPSDTLVQALGCMLVTAAAVLLLCPCLLLRGHSCMAVGWLLVETAQLALQSTCRLLGGHSWMAKGDWLVLAAALSHRLLLERRSWMAMGRLLMAAAQLSP